MIVVLARRVPGEMWDVPGEMWEVQGDYIMANSVSIQYFSLPWDGALTWGEQIATQLLNINKQRGHKWETKQICQ